MKFTKKLPLMLVAIMLMAAGALTITGCGEQPLSPIVNDTGGDIGGEKFGDDPAASPGVVGNTVHGVVRKVTAVVGVLGGEVYQSFGRGKQAGLTIPAQALNEATVISMKATVFGGPQTRAIFDFGPDGLEFQRPATLFLDVRDPNGTIKTLTWYNPSTGGWDFQSKAAVRDGRVQFVIHHFSKYGIS